MSGNLLKNRMELLEMAEAQGKALKPEHKAELAHYRALGLIKGGKGGGADANGPPPTMPADETLRGDAFLKAMEPSSASQVKALAEGRMAAPSAAALRTPYWQAMQKAVARYDPNFDMANYPVRVATRKDFTAGKDGRSLSSLAAMAGHANDLEQRITGPAGTPLVPLNTVANFLMRNLGGDPGHTNDYQLNADGLATEFASVLKGGSSAPTEPEIKSAKSHLSVNDPENVKHSAIKTVREMAAKRAIPLLDRYAAGMGTTHEGLSRMMPEIQPILDTIKAQQAGAAPPATSGGMPPDIAAMYAKHGGK